MSDPPVSVNIIRAFEGWRHARLEFLWQCVAEYCQDYIRLNVFPNPGGHLSHARCLNLIWEQELKRPEPYAIITEFDFLPELRDGAWFDPCPHMPGEGIGEEYPIVASQYVTRHPETGGIVEAPMTVGAWYLLIDKTVVSDLDFSPVGRYNDAANGLLDYLGERYNDKGIIFLKQYDAMPRHYGTEMLTGEHLFWSRHLHDDPSAVIAGCQLGDIQKRHDKAVMSWLRNMPSDFKELVRHRDKTSARRHAARSRPVEDTPDHMAAVAKPDN